MIFLRSPFIQGESHIRAHLDGGHDHLAKARRAHAALRPGLLGEVVDGAAAPLGHRFVPGVFLWERCGRGVAGGWQGGVTGAWQGCGRGMTEMWQWYGAGVMTRAQRGHERSTIRSGMAHAPPASST